MKRNAAQHPPLRRRQAAKEQRRLQLIKATIDAVARRGFAGTNISDVARAAGMSQGMVNLHFESKEKLLVETLRFLADEYKSAWETALERAGPTAAKKLAQLVELDFTPALCDRRKLAVWFAFWGEARSRPTYLRLCKQRDQEYDEALHGLCRQVIVEGRYKHADADVIASSLAALTDGLWMDILISHRSMSASRARRISFAYLANVFPGHFTDEGVVA
ncbi:MAG: HTH-type transcriptional regulator BetI [Gammaproteobacteria bacterium]|nr:HTH-type transcriptional regulator BetI [Gammaproteobacteria bacterium]